MLRYFSQYDSCTLVFRLLPTGKLAAFRDMDGYGRVIVFPGNDFSPEENVPYECGIRVTDRARYRYVDDDGQKRHEYRVAHASPIHSPVADVFDVIDYQCRDSNDSKATLGGQFGDVLRHVQTALPERIVSNALGKEVLCDRDAFERHEPGHYLFGNHEHGFVLESVADGMRTYVFVRYAIGRYGNLLTRESAGYFMPIQILTMNRAILTKAYYKIQNWQYAVRDAYQACCEVQKEVV